MSGLLEELVSNLKSPIFGGKAKSSSKMTVESKCCFVYKTRNAVMLSCWIVGILMSDIAAAGSYTDWLVGKSTKTEKNQVPNDDLVSPIVNRELEASVVAKEWPFIVDNVYCEAWAYHGFQDWEYMDRFAQLLTDSQATMSQQISVTQATDLVLQASSIHISSLLKYSLSLRANSPVCELHRSLARQIVLSIPTLRNHDAFCFIPSKNQVISSPNELVSMVSSQTEISVENDGYSEEEILLTKEHMRGNAGPLIVLYANMGSPAFLDFYKNLIHLNCKFVIRHLGHVNFEEVGGNTTVLQGYGVRLDIRNVEYRVFDDRTEGLLNEAALFNVSTLDHITNNLLAGIQVSSLKNIKEEDALRLQKDLWKLHEAQQIHSQIVPPKWQRRRLALQAATVISQASDVLLTLQDVSQNLPSVASTLVHVTVTDEALKLCETMESVLSHNNGVALTVNGRQIPIGRPSFNVFEMLQIIQDEQKALDDMQAVLRPYIPFAGLRQIQKAWALGKDAFLASKKQSDSSSGWIDNDGDDGSDSDLDSGLSGNAKRVDVGRDWKNAIIYVNDVEKDSAYRDWPRSLQQALMAMQFGAPPSVRRNLFTMLCVIDPTEEGNSEHPGFQLGSQLLQAQFPVRLGYLVVSQKDLEECRIWMESTGNYDEKLPCPTKPILTKSQSNTKVMGTIPATTHAAHRLISMVATEYAGKGIAITFVEYFTQYLDQFLQGGDLTMADLVSSFAQLMEGLVRMRLKDATNMAVEALLKDDEKLESVSSYGKSLRFALQKAISPGMSFLNGRPIEKDGNPSQIFMDEQNHVFGLVMKGEITDTSPRSVYGKLLSGDGVFKRLHPLLRDSNKEIHLDLQHGFLTSSLLSPKDANVKSIPDAVFVTEAIVDLETSQGVTFATRFLQIMDSYTGTDPKVSMSITFRIVPFPSCSKLSIYSILAYAGAVGAGNIATLLSLEDVTKMTVDELLSKLPSLSTETKEAISQFTCASDWSIETMPSKSFLTVNGKVYEPKEGSVTKLDIDMLVDLELSRSKATTKFLKDVLSPSDISYHDAISKASTFLAIQHGKEDKTQRIDMVQEVIALENANGIEVNPFRFSWNMKETDNLKIQVSAAIDPATESAQKVSPFLLVFRDVLKLPLEIVLIPKSLVGDAKNVPITSYYRFVADPFANPDQNPPKAYFSNLPTNHILTLRLDVPEPWNVQQTKAVQDTDNLRCDVQSGCSDDAVLDKDFKSKPLFEKRQLTTVEYGLKSLMVFGQCYDASTSSPPNGLQLILTKFNGPVPLGSSNSAEVSSDGSITLSSDKVPSPVYSDTLVMKNVGYWQLRANPGIWQLEIAPDSRGAEIFDIVEGTIKRGKIKVSKNSARNTTKLISVNDFTGKGEVLVLKRRPGLEKASLFYDKDSKGKSDDKDVIHVFSLATGHLYERFLKIMMLSVTKRTSSKVKFWLFENFLSPSFKGSAKAMADRIGCDLEFVTYKWPEWLRGQSEKQRIIWGYKILFLDVLFPLSVKKIIYVDADQVVRGDLKELWNMNLKGAPYGYTPMCSSRESTLGFQFWRGGFWEQHLRGKPYHISALYVVDLVKFRKDLVGDNLRAIYQQLSADPNSLANLDQDLPNYAQHQVPIFSLPQEWLWCESWCSDQTKPKAKTIDLCNNPLHKEPKVTMAKRIISGPLFPESWVELDAEVEGFEKEYFDSNPGS
jgi:UDP-glucose:glycoprotein glucosyltransferase